MWACASAGSGASGFDRECHVAAVVPVVSIGSVTLRRWCLRFHAGALELCRWRLRFRSGLCVGRLVVTGGAFVGCVGGLVVTGGAFVGGFWARLRCFVLSVVPAVSCGRVRALAVVPVVSIGSVTLRRWCQWFHAEWVLVGWVKPVGPLLVVFGLDCGVLCYRWCLRFHVGVNACWQWCQWFQPGLGVGRLGETGGAFVGGFWARLRCFVLSVVPAVSCGRVRALAVVPVVSIGSVDAAAVASLVSRGCARAVSVVPVVSCGRV